MLSSLHVDVYEDILCFASLRGLYCPLGSILTAYSRGIRLGKARSQAQAVKKAEAGKGWSLLFMLERSDRASCRRRVRSGTVKVGKKILKVLIR